MALPLCLEYFTRRLTLSFSLCNRSMLLSNFHLILQFFFPGKTLLGSLMQQRGVKTGNMLPCLFPRCRERACSLYGVGVGVCRAGGSRGASGPGPCPLWSSRWSARGPQRCIGITGAGNGGDGTWLQSEALSSQNSFSSFMSASTVSPLQPL